VAEKNSPMRTQKHSLAVWTKIIASINFVILVSGAALIGLLNYLESMLTAGELQDIFGVWVDRLNIDPRSGLMFWSTIIQQVGLGAAGIILGSLLLSVKRNHKLAIFSIIIGILILITIPIALDLPIRLTEYN
jgi:hypothetical protein